MKQLTEPKTLQEAIIYFSDADRCLDYLAIRRWKDGMPICPTCGRKDAKFLTNQRKWQCKSGHAKRQFSVKVGTIFEDSPVPLEKWLPAVWVIVNCKNGVSSYELAKSLGLTQKTTWFMLHRIRKAMGIKSDVKMGGTGSGNDTDGEFEFDETYVGGGVRNMHKSRRLKINQERSKTVTASAPTVGRYANKTPVFGIFDRETRTVRAKVVPNVKRDILQAEILKQVQLGSKVYTDESLVYAGLAKQYAHGVVNHLHHYVDGRIHTNGLENFWSLVKRTLNGTYVSVEPFHLERYIDEQVFRFNNRATKENPMTDSDRFSLALTQIAGKRLTYEELTGKDAARQV